MQAYTRNLRTWYARANDEQKLAGMQWYAVARAEAERLATLHNRNVETVAGVIAAVSPRITWEENLKAAARLLEDGADATGLAGFRTNHRKALRILDGESPKQVLGGQKVRAFYANIVAVGEGEGEGEVTVDTWAARAAMGHDDVKNLDRAGRYEKIARAYRTVARELSLQPKQFQAIVWLAIRDADAAMQDAY